MLKASLSQKPNSHLLKKAAACQYAGTGDTGGTLTAEFLPSGYGGECSYPFRIHSQHCFKVLPWDQARIAYSFWQYKIVMTGKISTVTLDMLPSDVLFSTFEISLAS